MRREEYVACIDGKSGHFLVCPDWKRGLVPFSHCAPITTRY